jgi:hypothetical protein
LIKITQRFADFNNEGVRDIYYDTLSVYSSFGGQLVSMGHKLNKAVLDSFGCKEIVLAKQLS